ncbi:phage antirepressor KilAC domain-containing protein, partial [Parabacteroides goldsteinii]
VLFADAVSTSRRSCLIAELAKILQQNGIKIGQNRLFEWLRKNGYLCQKWDTSVFTEAGRDIILL